MIRLMLLLLVLGTLPLSAGTIVLNFGKPVTLTTTAAQDAAITRVLATINADRVAKKLPVFTAEQWLQDVLIDAITSYTDQARSQESVSACATFRKLPPAQQASIRSTLGGDSPCP